MGREGGGSGHPARGRVGHPRGVSVGPISVAAEELPDPTMSSPGGLAYHNRVVLFPCPGRARSGCASSAAGGSLDREAVPSAVRRRAGLAAYGVWATTGAPAGRSAEAVGREVGRGVRAGGYSASGTRPTYH